MAFYTWTIQSLQALSATSLQLTYNTDGADTLSLTLRPENYAELPLQALDRLTVTDGGRIVFSGLVPMGANCAAEAAAGETVDITLQSDYYVLDHTVYAKLNSKGDAVYARTSANSPTTTLSAVCSSVDSWLGEFLPSRLSCEADAVVPTPNSNGTAPCSSLLSSGMRWVPNAVLVQRYGETSTLTVTTPEQLGEPLVLSPSTHPLQSVSLAARHDLQVPVCALVGGVHATYPVGADIRTLGAFVYAVPIEETESGRAGGSAASAKMIVRGVHLPERVIYEPGPDEYDAEIVTAATETERFIKHFLPEYAPFIPYNLKAGMCLVQPVSEEAYEDELQETDEDAKLPANYNTDLQTPTWANIYVHTEGSFPAATRSKKNIKKLRWCKATVSLVLAIKMSNGLVPRSMWETGELLFPGRRKASDGERYGYVKKVFTVNLINRRKKIYDPATNSLCSTDSDYSEEENSEDTPTAADCKEAMRQYFAAASQLQHEGSISLLHDGSLTPETLTGRLLRVADMRSEWAEMHAVVRSVSWNYEQRKLSLSVGPRAVMGFDEYLERRVIARNRGRDEAQKNALAYDPEDEEAQKDAEDDMSVSPSISANTDTSSLGRWVKPFTLYSTNDGMLMMRGGTLKKGGNVFEVADSDKQIVFGEATGPAWEKGKKLHLFWYTMEDKTLTYSITQ